MSLRSAVVIPTYGRRESLLRSLESVAAMRPEPELVLVVDGNEQVVPLPDRMGARAEVLPEPNQGAAHARNTGFRAAADRGAEVVCFLDDDALAPVDWLERHASLHEAWPHAGAVGGGVRNLHPESAVARMIQTVAFRPLREDPGPVRFVATLNASFKVACLEEVGLFDEELPRSGGGEDVDLCWRILKAGWAIHYEPSLTVGHDHPTSWRTMMRHQAGYARGFVATRRRWPDLPGAEFLALAWPKAVAGSIPHVVRETRRAVRDGGPQLAGPALVRETVFRFHALRERARGERERRERPGAQ